MSGTFTASVVALTLAAAGLIPVRTTQDEGQDRAQAAYDRAYTLENEAHARAEALALYERLLADDGVDPDLRARARSRARLLAEDLASADFAALMPGNALVYLELNRPGEQLSALLGQLGLLDDPDAAPTDGAPSFAVRPELIEGLIGIRGAALAITGLPTGDGPPGGVLVLHPGEDGVARGLLETTLAAVGRPVEPIEGQPSWRLEDQVYVTRTARLLVASTSRGEIAGVLRRLRGERSDSLAANAAMRANLALRGDDLVYACLNAAPLSPMLPGLLAMGTAQNPELALAAALLDVESFQSVVVRAGVDADGMSIDAVLRLDEGHRNLAFNFLRPAPLDRRLLHTIPAGVAGFVTASFNERGPALAPLPLDANEQPLISGMDLGREVFANIVGVSVFGLDSGEGAAAGVPGVAAVLSANDPDRSRAIWSLGLGLLGLATGGVSLEPGEHEIAGHAAERYVVAGHLPVFLVQHETELLISPSEAAIASALRARDEGRSVLVDPAFAAELARLDPGATSAAMFHLGRLAQAATPFLPERQRAELAPVSQLVAGTTLAVGARHSANELGGRLAVHGLPRVDGLVAELLRKRQGAPPAGRSSVPVAEVPNTPDEPQAAFERLVQRGAFEEARGAATRLVQSLGDDGRALNNFAWALLTEERYQQQFDALALRASLRSNEVTRFEVWQYVDTLALAYFRNGDFEAAIRLQEQALELVGDGTGRAEMEASLKRYQEARRGVVVR